MKDNFDEKLDALFAAARTSHNAAPPDTSHAEYAFETRLAARLRAENAGTLSAWAWKLCPFFAALALAVGWWSHTSQRTEGITSLVTEAAPTADEQLVAYMTGDRP